MRIVSRATQCVARPLVLAVTLLGFANSLLAAVSTPFGVSYQVNVNGSGQNIPGDAANEPSLCLDPNNPNRIAIGWRQFDTTNSNFRQAGWGYSTDGGANWTLGGVLETNVFRSDPVLAADAAGQFYYLSLKISPVYACDLWKSTNGGMNWQLIGPAQGGDKAWMVIDRTTSPGRGNIYEDWDPAQPNTYSNRLFSRSVDLGATWLDPLAIPHTPEWGTLDVGPKGEVYLLGRTAGQFWMNRSLNVTNNAAAPSFDLTVLVNLGGSYPGIATSPINPEGLLGQPWIAVDKSSGPTRGNVYALCSTVTNSNPSQISFVRSTNAGTNWSAPIRINTDAAYTNAWHWFGTLGVAPNGRIDVCWYDTRSDPNNTFSELYYCF